MRRPSCPWPGRSSSWSGRGWRGRPARTGSAAAPYGPSRHQNSCFCPHRRGDAQALAPTTVPTVIDLTGKTLLITGGTGSFGTAFIRAVLARHDVHSIRVFSRDELKQSELQNTLNDSRLRWLLGDVRDADRLRVATKGGDALMHAAP